MKEENKNNTNYKYQYQDGECWLNKVDENAGSDELFERAKAYHMGLGTQMDRAKAASMGNPESMCTIGTCYLRGEVFKQNTNKAIEYLTRSAELGNTLAMQRLVEVYQLAGDHQKAQYWEDMQNPN